MITIAGIFVAVAMLLHTNGSLDVAELVHITWLDKEACNIRCLLLFIEAIPGWSFATVCLRFPSPVVVSSTSLTLVL